MQVIFFTFIFHKHKIIMDTPNFDKIDPRVCVNAKVRKLHRMLNTAYQSKINPFGLRGSMLSILFIIGKRKGVNQKTIADALVLDQSTMSRDLKKLMQKGWVSSTKGKDSRYSQLALTEDGQALLEEVTPVWEALQEKIAGILGANNIQQIDQLIASVKTNLTDIKN